MKISNHIVFAGWARIYLNTSGVEYLSMVQYSVYAGRCQLSIICTLKSSHFLYMMAYIFFDRLIAITTPHDLNFSLLMGGMKLSYSVEI